MFINLFFSDPAVGIVWVVAILMALTVHEFSHAAASRWRGDRTAERAGRLTLNPLSHIDWFGLIPLLLLGFGWAKPVPYNPNNLKNPKWDSVIVGLAGPASNLTLAIASALVLRGLLAANVFTELNLLVIFLVLFILINMFLLLFNIIPIHPLDGSKLFLAIFDAPKYAKLRAFVLQKGPTILLVAVLIAIITNIPIFAFISVPSFAACSALVGTDCLSFLALIFAG